MRSITNLADRRNDAQSVGDTPVTEYKYALRVTPQDLQDMDREQLLAVATEVVYLLSLILSIVRNPMSMITSRLVALDLLFATVEQAAHQACDHNILSKFSTTIFSKDTYKPTITKRLGISKNNASDALARLEQAGHIEKFYETEGKGDDTRTHLDVALQRDFLLYPGTLMDKMEYTKSEKAPREKKETTCSVCGGTHVDEYHVTQCADPACGYVKVETLQETGPRFTVLHPNDPSEIGQAAASLSEPARIEPASVVSPIEIQGEPVSGEPMREVAIRVERSEKPMYRCKHCHICAWVVDANEWICARCWTPAIESVSLSWFTDTSRLRAACSELERAARRQQDPPEWVVSILTDVGWEHWAALAAESEVE